MPLVRCRNARCRALLESLSQRHACVATTAPIATTSPLYRIPRGGL